MKWIETKTERMGRGMVPVQFVRIVEGEEIPQGLTQVPDETPVSDWHTEEAK